MAQPPRQVEDGAQVQGVRSYPPRMSRSQPQLATAYAPGSLFTWEGGKGACISVPVDGAAIDFSGRPVRRDQILETLREFCKNWLARGLNVTRTPRIYEQQLLDDCFHTPMRRDLDAVDIRIEGFEFLRPERMGYLPGPLNYRCEVCATVREYISPSHQLAEPLPRVCAAEGERPMHDARWRQLDVVYVHWSGAMEGLSPYRYTLDRSGALQKIPRCQCGAANFRLIKQGTQFSRWRFVCSGCASPKEVYQTDPFSLNLLKPLMDRGEAHQWSEINMVPISYRASPAYYVQTARFIVFDSDPEVITLMSPDRAHDLVSRVASLHGFAAGDPSDDQIREQVERAGQGAAFVAYETFRRNEAEAVAAGDAQMTETWRSSARMLLDGWYNSGIVARAVSASPALQERVRERDRYARRFDPIRGTVEHDALRRRKIGVSTESADLRIAQPDLCPEHGTPDLERSYQQRVSADLDRAGIEDARLIRNLDMVEFSFGYSRVSAGPETVQKDRPMPVRLMGFPELPSRRRPVYVIEQQNEALYVRLHEAMVVEFLRSNGVLTDPPAAPRTLGGYLIEQYRDFGPFLKEFSVRDPASRVRSRDISSMTYLLLHSLAHHVMHGVARFSGLDLGSLSEVIFPADLAFAVHRRGMTEDLGNISSMWRDQNAALLRYLVAHRELRCGSGTLCDHRGGACPACIMIPENSCVAGNQLLSRAVLIGGRAPIWDTDQTPLHGYFDIVNQHRLSRADH